MFNTIIFLLKRQNTVRSPSEAGGSHRRRGGAGRVLQQGVHRGLVAALLVRSVCPAQYPPDHRRKIPAHNGHLHHSLHRSH